MCRFNNLCTHDLYSPLRDGFDAGKSIGRGPLEGVGPKKRDFFRALKWLYERRYENKGTGHTVRRTSTQTRAPKTT